GDQQRTPAVAGDLIDVHSCGQYGFHRVEIIGARGVDQWGEFAAIIRLLLVSTASAEAECCSGVGLIIAGCGIVARGSCGCSTSSAAASSTLAAAPLSTTPTALRLSIRRLDGCGSSAALRDGAKSAQIGGKLPGGERRALRCDCSSRIV